MQDKPQLPSFPKYEGLAFNSTGLPLTMPDVAFPPLAGLVSGIDLTPAGEVPVPGVPEFTVTGGLLHAPVKAEAVSVAVAVA